MKILLIITLIQGIFQTNTSLAWGPIIPIPCEDSNTCPFTRYEAVLIFKKSDSGQMLSKTVRGVSFSSCQSARRLVISEMSGANFIPRSSGQPPLIWWWRPISTPNCG